MAVHLENVAVDCRDAVGLTRFWADVLGWQARNVEPGWVELRAPDGAVPGLDLLEVPEPKTVKNRLHLDLRPDDQAAEVARIEALGARRTDVGQGGDVSWIVLADPEGNEFCVLRERPTA
jgi:predicted enzyme related to lactoylglutathione lyase